VQRSQEFQDGYRAASKEAVRLMHCYAEEMNDGNACQVLNSAALSLGVALKKQVVDARVPDGQRSDP